MAPRRLVRAPEFVLSSSSSRRGWFRFGLIMLAWFGSSAIWEGERRRKKLTKAGLETTDNCTKTVWRFQRMIVTSSKDHFIEPEVNPNTTCLLPEYRCYMGFYPGQSSSGKLGGREVKTSAPASRRSWARMLPVKFFHRQRRKLCTRRCQDKTKSTE